MMRIWSSALAIVWAACPGVANALPCALSPGDQRDLCRARRFYVEAHGKDPAQYAKSHTADDVPIHLARFTTAEEYQDVYKAGMAVMLPVIERGPAGPAGTTLDPGKRSSP
jgi:hypothetical protein